MDYGKLMELAKAVMEELDGWKLKRVLRENGLTANDLADMGFSESFLYGLGMSVEEADAV